MAFSERSISMSKILKIVLSTVAIVLLLLVGSGVYLSRNLPDIIKGIVEKEAPQVTGTDVTLGGVQIIYGTGRVVVKDLVIKNPTGFSSPHAFWLHKLVFQISIPSVFQDVVVIDELSIENANIIAEQAGNSLKTNLQVIADHAKSATGNAKNPPSDSAPKKVIIREFRFTGNSIDLVSEQWGDRTIAIPDLVLNDIGKKKEGGLTPDQLSQHIIKLVTRQANEAAKEELRELAKSTITGKIKDKLGGFFRVD